MRSEARQEAVRVPECGENAESRRARRNQGKARSPRDLFDLGGLRWLRGLDLNQLPLGYEPIAGLHALQRATARRRENAQLALSTLAPAGRRWWQFSGRNPVAERPSALARKRRSTSGGAVVPAVASLPVT